MPLSAAARFMANAKLREGKGKVGTYSKRTPLGSGIKKLVSTLKGARPFSLKGTY